MIMILLPIMLLLLLLITVIMRSQYLQFDKNHITRNRKNRHTIYTNKHTHELTPSIHLPPPFLPLHTPSFHYPPPLPSPLSTTPIYQPTSKKKNSTGPHAGFPSSILRPRSIFPQNIVGRQNHYFLHPSLPPLLMMAGGGGVRELE